MGDCHRVIVGWRRWIAAQDLRSGLRLKTSAGTVGVRSVVVRTVPYMGKVYDLKIKNGEQYLVGKDGVIVRDW